jgi:uncharacterized protein (TIGR02145 family)
MKTKNKIGIYRLIVMGLALILANNCRKHEEPSAIKDNDGNTYSYVTIGTQVWMKENLKTTKYNDGVAIPRVPDNTAWSNLAAPGYCWYDNNQASYKNSYGALYNWYAVNTGKLCPSGWHVPTDDDWTTLLNYLDINGFNYDGSTGGWKIGKSLAANSLWASSSTAGAVGNTDYPAKRNATGFTAFPGGRRDIDGAFKDLGSWGLWWSNTEKDAANAWSRYLIFSSPYGLEDISNKRCGFSVRCIED